MTPMGSANHLTWFAQRVHPHDCTTAVPTIGIKWPTGVAREAKHSVGSSNVTGSDVHTTTKGNSTASVGHCTLNWCDEQTGKDGWTGEGVGEVGGRRKGGSPFTQGTHSEPNAPERTQATCSHAVWHKAKVTTRHRICVLQCDRDTLKCNLNLSPSNSPTLLTTRTP